MRILHLDGGREMRGGQRQVLRLIEGLNAAGVESTLMARQGGPLYRAAQALGWPVAPLGVARAFREARHCELVHAHDGRGHTVGAVVSPGKLVVSRRVAFAVRSRLKYRRARHYLAVSEFVARVLEAGGVPREKISVVYDGVPLLEPARGTRVMTPASDDPEKGTALAIEAAQLAGVDLTISGDLERDLPQAGLFVYITRSEGLGSGALLAMSAGLPVMASNVGGLPEAIEHGRNGILVENDAGKIAAALGALRADGDLSRRLGEAARLTVKEKFTVDRMVGRTMEVYRQVLG